MKPTFTLRRLLPGYLICLFFLGILYGNAQPVTIASEDYKVDTGLKLIVCNRIPVIPSSPQSLTLVFDKNYTYSAAGEAFQIGKEYTLGSSDGNYKLFFTNFPIIAFNTNGVAISEDDNRTKGTVSIANPGGSPFSSSMGVRVRGNTSRLNPKKSYNMELWKDPAGNEEFETSLFGMREDSKWLFLALYNEPLRVNNVASWAIWLKMHQLYYAGQEAGALPGIRTRYCDVFINNSYNGVYVITEDLDRKQLKLKKTRDNGEIRGELYKTGAKTDATGFTSVFNNNPLPPYDNNSATWSGYEMDYPKTPFWNNLFGIATFINKSTDEDFKNQVAGKFKLDNLIDNFLFLNAVGASDDNFGNNQFIARYKENEPYIFLPWDFDITLGNYYGSVDPVGENVRFNGFYYRLLTLNPNGFKSRMKKRWLALRQGDLTNANYKKNLTDNTTLLTNEGAYKREELRWPASLRLSEQTAILNWVDKRLTVLDQYFADFPDQDPSAVNVTLLNFTGQVSGAEKALQWTTSSEKEASRFEVEFSADGLTYGKVGEVAASGNSAVEKAYSFTHSDASAVAYYRLKIFNTNGLFKYSDPLLIGACPSPPAVPTLTASATAINAGQSTVLTAAGCAQTVLWNTGQSGSQLTVSPATTTTYQARCRQSSGCESVFSEALTVKVNPVTAYDGYLSTASCTVISGWAWDGKQPNAPVVVEILEGQTVIAFAVADIYRSELKTAGKGNGLHAYAFEPPKILYDNKPHVLSARIKGSSFTLKQGPKTVTCPLTNNAPLAPTIAPLSATVNTGFSWTLPMFFDADYGAVYYSLSGLPGGLSFDPISRDITGVPTAPGTFNLTYSASDGIANTPVLISLVVSTTGSVPEPVNQQPQPPAISPLSATVNAAYTITLAPFTDTDPLTYALNGLPNGLEFTPGTRVITGIPTVSGAFSLTYTATDNQLASSFLVISLTVSPAVSVPPSTTVTGNFEGYLDKVECGSIRGWVWDRNKPNTALTIEFFANNISIGTVNADIFRQDLKDAGKGNGAHAYSFTTPEYLKDGQLYAIRAKVKDSDYALKGSPKNLTCPGSGTGIPPTETGNQPPQAPATVPLSATLNTAFSATLPPFTDADPLTYSLTGLPGGLNFAGESRQLTGTPQVSGSFSLTYAATDGQLTTRTSFLLVVHASAPVSATVTGNFEGYLDKVECGSMRGWVWDRNQPNTPLMVEFFANANSIGTVKADIFRQDLKDSGKGNGAHAYSFPTPASVKTGASFQISAKVQNSSFVLKWSPKSLNCPEGSRLSVVEDSGAESGDLLTVWPNPSDGNFEIRYTLEAGKPGELSVVDASGRGWYRKSVEGVGPQRQKVSLIGAQGIFFVQLRQGATLQTKKMVIEK
ncbi:CotH kinase family protein [Larkinella sp. C7]|uniref:CotH kinase family protein n=1 Tax=Larkinella sp. C7 TaxID=2576607 RepID=UPI0014860237|nr:CotH kinase family protein [Larkinella sp. C7]